MRQAGSIKKRAISFLAVQKSLLEQTVQRSHHGGVGETAVQLRDHVANTELASSPQDVHYLEFERAEQQLVAVLVDRAVNQKIPLSSSHETVNKYSDARSLSTET